MNLLKDQIKTLSNFHKSSNDNVAIFSCPRSGSTWLMEMIWSQPGFKTCNEPLNVRGETIKKAITINEFEGVYDPANKERVIRYFKEIASGKHRFLNPNPFRKFYKPVTSRIVYKIINGGEQWINEIAEATQSKKIILIRHPFTVSLSRRQLPRLSVLTSKRIIQAFSDEELQVINEILAKNDALEKAVLSWCIQNKLMLQNASNALIFTYEQLVVDPEPIIESITQFCDLVKPNRIRKHLNVPSAVTVQSQEGTSEQIAGAEREKLIQKWKGEISESKANELWKIIDSFGLDIYDKNTSLPKEPFKI